MRVALRLARGLVLVAVVVTGCTSATAPIASSGPTRGGTLTIAIWQEPVTLSPVHAGQTVAGYVASVGLEGLVRVDNEGNYQPLLVTKIPTTANGGVRLPLDGKGMDVTWELLPDLKWSDGEPLTSADIKATWDAFLHDPKSRTRSGFSEISTIDLPDERTAVLHYSSVYAPYLSTFLAGALFVALLPKHVLENESAASTYELTPVGTGPFRFTEFTEHSAITAERNPYYRKSGRPYLDRIVFRVVPRQEVALDQLKSGDVDGMWSLSEGQIADLSVHADLRALVVPSIGVERIEINFAQAKDLTDPSSVHPVLGDLAVRRALALATPKQELVDKLLFGKGRVGTAAVSQGWAAAKDVVQEGYDPAKARQLLDQAGWVTGPDGIRARNGVRASLTLTTTVGNQTRERAQEILIDAYRQVGIEVKAKNAAFAEAAGPWGDPRSFIQRGAFDLIMYNNPTEIDPHRGLEFRYRAAQIPSAENGGVGSNYMRFKDPELERALDEAAASLDLDKRRAAYAKVLRILNDKVVSIWLYERSIIDAYRVGVNGWTGWTWGYTTWSSEDWYRASAP